MSMPNQDVLFLPPDETGAWVCADKDEHVYIKEAIYEGDFSMASGESFKVDDGAVSHWVSTTRSMLNNGIKIPMPLGHTTDPEKNRGEIIGAHTGTNPQGKKALYLKAKFRDEEAAKLAKTSQVSIYSPPAFTDGKGNRYVRPITHVALTDYPVIPGLQGFKSIAASFVSNQREATMPLKALAGRLNIQCENDEQLEDTIVASFTALNESIADNATTLASKDEEITALKAKVPSDPITVVASHLSMLKDNRVMKLDSLCGEKISPAVKDGLVDLFCSPESLTLSLSTEAGDGGLFDKLVEILRKNEVVSLGPTDKIISLSKEDLANPEKNPLLADAKRRAEAS